MVDKIQSAIHHWTGNLLSYVGELKLINSVLFGLENYLCSALLLPKIVTKLVNKLCKDYFWGIPTGKRKMIFQSWKSVCFPWSEGGLNIKELMSLNKALLSRWVWLLTQDRVGIWDQWSRDYNMLGSFIWTTKSKPHHAESWRAILKTRDYLLDIAENQNAAQAILNSCVLRGHFIVRKAYDIFRPKHQKLGWTRVLSCPEILPKHRVCTYQADQKVLFTIDRISSRGYPLVNWCCLCKCASESHRHLFFRCQYSQHVRRLMLQWLGFPSSWSALDLKDWLYRLLHQTCTPKWKIILMSSCLAGLVFVIWEERNNRVFKGCIRSPNQVATQLKWVLKTCLSVSSVSQLRCWIENT
ncbi:uncharacterized protein LOC141601139 [Silene latifolia]|uniref:uncharacterized protein LOC141601139 n=1 Tax=Silene latifolia TaxID=37657 RepID=UPI003D788095